MTTLGNSANLPRALARPHPLCVVIVQTVHLRPWRFPHAWRAPDYAHFQPAHTTPRPQFSDPPSSVPN